MHSAVIYKFKKLIKKKKLLVSTCSPNYPCNIDKYEVFLLQTHCGAEEARDNLHCSTFNSFTRNAGYPVNFSGNSYSTVSHIVLASHPIVFLLPIFLSSSSPPYIYIYVFFFIKIILAIFLEIVHPFVAFSDVGAQAVQYDLYPRTSWVKMLLLPPLCTGTGIGTIHFVSPLETGCFCPLPQWAQGCCLLSSHKGSWENE